MGGVCWRPSRSCNNTQRGTMAGMFGRAINWVANEFLVEKLANSPTFQRFAVRVDEGLTNAKKNMAESSVAGNAKKMAEDAVKAAAKQATGNASLEAELAAKKAAEAKLKAARVAEQKAQAEAKVQAEKAAEQFRAQQQAQAAQQGAHSR